VVGPARADKGQSSQPVLLRAAKSLLSRADHVNWLSRFPLGWSAISAAGRIRSLTRLWIMIRVLTSAEKAARGRASVIQLGGSHAKVSWAL
jgi:hypothetical protein